MLRKTGQIPIFSIGSDASYDSGTVFFSNNPFLRKLCGLSFLLQIEVIHGLIRLCTHSKISLCLSKFCMPYNLASPSIKNSSLTLCGRIIGSWKELDNLTLHDNHHSSRIMRTYHTHFGVPLGNTSGWWDDRKRNHKPVSPIYLRLIFPTISAVHFLAFAFLAITFWSKECVITEIEGLMSSGSVTNVTGTLFRTRSTFCWTVRMKE